MTDFVDVSLEQSPGEGATAKVDQSILSSSLLDEITCAICLDVYEEPKRTSCLHVACRRCLEEYHYSSKNETDVATCPQCRAPSIYLPNGDASSLPPAIDKEQLIKLYRQEQEKDNEHIGLCSLCQNESAHLHGRCFSCQENYCQTCFVHHAHFYPPAVHQTRTFDEIRLLPRAPIQFDEQISLKCSTKHHHRPLEFFCTKCSECLCAECLIDETMSFHRQQFHPIKLLSQVAQDHRYQLERLYLHRLKPIHRELNEAIEFISKILDRDQRLFVIFDHLQKQEEKVNDLEKLMQTLVNHAHDVHVVLFEKQARDQLNEILHERPARPRQGHLLHGLRFESAHNSRAFLKIILPIEVLPTINDPIAQHVEHVYLDFLPTKIKHVYKPTIGYQVAYDQSDSTFLRLFGSLIPQQIRQFTCSLYSYSYPQKQYKKEDTTDLLFNFPKKFDFELKQTSKMDSITYSDFDNQLTLTYEVKSDCLTVKEFNLMFNLSIHERKKENFLHYDIQLSSIHLRLFSNGEKLLLCGLKSHQNKPICFIYDFQTFELLDSYSSSIGGPTIQEILDVLIYNDEQIVLCLQSIDQRLFFWIGKEYVEEIAFSGMDLSEHKCVIDRLALSEQMDILLAYRNLEQDEHRTCFAISKYLFPSAFDR